MNVDAPDTADFPEDSAFLRIRQLRRWPDCCNEDSENRSPAAGSRVKTSGDELQ
jgi:hypothetical protein